MKKLFYSIIFLMAAIAFFHYGGKITHQTQEFQQTLESSPVVDAIKKEVFTSGPLRSTVNAPHAQLTVPGVIKFTNQERTNQNLPALKHNSQLDSAAALKVKDMFDKQYFEHISPQGVGPSDLATRVGYQYIAIGENLALGNYKDDQDLVTAWMNSPGHRANILNNKFTEIGVAVGKGNFEGQEVWLAVQEFGRPASSCPSVDMSLKSQIDSYKAELDSLQQQIISQKQQLEQFSPQTSAEYDQYNRMVGDYNSLIRIYNNKLDILKQLTAKYNSQVQAYNSCLSK